MSAREYWFARRFPLRDPRAAMVPVHWKGWAMSAVFAGVLTLGGLLFAFMARTGRMVEGIAIFVLVSFISGAWFLLLTQANGDKVRTAADYKKEKLGA